MFLYLSLSFTFSIVKITFSQPNPYSLLHTIILPLLTVSDLFCYKTYKTHSQVQVLAVSSFYSLINTTPTPFKKWFISYSLPTLSHHIAQFHIIFSLTPLITLSSNIRIFYFKEFTYSLSVSTHTLSLSYIPNYSDILYFVFLHTFHSHTSSKCT